MGPSTYIFSVYLWHYRVRDARCREARAEPSGLPCGLHFAAFVGASSRACCCESITPQPAAKAWLGEGEGRPGLGLGSGSGLGLGLGSGLGLGLGLGRLLIEVYYYF